MPQFDLSSFSSQLFWLAVVFAGLYFIVSRFIAPKAESILTARNRFMEENISYAEDYRKKAKTLDIKKQEKVTEVNARVEEIRQGAIKLLEANFSKKREYLSLTLDQKKKTAIAEIEKYVDKFHAEQAHSCISLAELIIEKITDKPADKNLLKEIYSRA